MCSAVQSFSGILIASGSADAAQAKLALRRDVTIRLIIQKHPDPECSSPLLQLITPVEATTEQLLDVHTEAYLSQLHSSSAKVSQELHARRPGSKTLGQVGSWRRCGFRYCHQDDAQTGEVLCQVLGHDHQPWCARSECAAHARALCQQVATAIASLTPAQHYRVATDPVSPRLQVASVIDFPPLGVLPHCLLQQKVRHQCARTARTTTRNCLSLALVCLLFATVHSGSCSKGSSLHAG